MKKQSRILAALALVGMLGLSACSSGTSPESGSGDAQDGGILRIAIEQEPPHLNRNLLSQPQLGVIVPMINEQLFDQNADNEIVPVLATGYEVSDDGLVYTINLRDGVKWHDGEPFTSADVVFTLQPETLEYNPKAALLNDVISEVVAVDDLTVEIHLTEPYAPTMGILSGGIVSILPAHAYEGEDILTSEVNSAPIGTGPYKFVSWTLGQEIVLERNDDYWDGAANFDGVSIRVIPDATTRLNALQAGEVDFLGGNEISPEQYGLIQSNPSTELREVFSETATCTLEYNNQSGPLADQRVRAAITQAIDRQQAVDIVYGASATLPTSVIPDKFTALTDSDSTFDDAYPYDPEAAAAALDDAGYPEQNGTRLTLNAAFASLPHYVSFFGVLEAQLAEIGVDLNLQAMDEQSWVDKVYTNFDFDLSFACYTDNVDPVIGVERLYSCDRIGATYGNNTGYCNEVVQSAFEENRRLSDVSERAELYATATKQIIADIPRLPVASTHTTVAYNTVLTNMDAQYARTDASGVNWAVAAFAG